METSISLQLNAVVRQSRFPDQYFGRCEIAHCRACSIGAGGGNAARSFCTVGNASILSRHRQKAEYFGYMPFPPTSRTI
jgi:hypothetical protein